MNVQIKNCNNIEEGNIVIEKDKLNIKYAINGTGKSTIGKAIAYANNNELEKLKTFGVDIEPNVIIDSKLNKIIIFNSDFVNNENDISKILVERHA